MQARTGARTAEPASLLESFGIELSAGGLVVMTDFRPFAAHVLDVVARYELDAFFLRDARLSINGIDVRPGVVGYRTNEVDKEAMADWRRAYNALPPVRRMMVATIIWLYRGGADKTDALAQHLACSRCGRCAASGRGAARLGPVGCALSRMVSRGEYAMTSKEVEITFRVEPEQAALRKVVEPDRP